MSEDKERALKRLRQLRMDAAGRAHEVEEIKEAKGRLTSDQKIALVEHRSEAAAYAAAIDVVSGVPF